MEKTVSPQTLFLDPKLVPVKDCPDLRCRAAGTALGREAAAVASARLSESDGTDERAMRRVVGVNRKDDMMQTGCGLGLKALTGV